MARRGIGQEQLWAQRVARPGGTLLDEVAALMDWTELDQLLARISACQRRSNFGSPALSVLSLRSRIST